MKKILMILVALIGFGISFYANDGFCKIPGTNDYVQATISGKNVIVVNGSSKTLAYVHVEIYADVAWTDENGKITKYSKELIFSDDFYSIPPNKTQSKVAITCTECKNFDIKVSNPSCE